MLPMLLDPENQDDNIWADSTYSEQCFEDLLSLGSFESRIHEKGSRNHPQIGLELGTLKGSTHVLTIT